MQATPLIVHFRTPSKAPVPSSDPFQDEIERFAAADPRWRSALEMAGARLDARVRLTLGVALSGLDAGPAPRLMPFDFGPDDEEATRRELQHMAPRLLAGLRLIGSPRLALRRDDASAVRGVVTAVHRLLRIAKTRP